jgi:hypothetical protein
MASSKYHINAFAAGRRRVTEVRVGPNFFVQKGFPNAVDNQ